MTFTLILCTPVAVGAPELWPTVSGSFGAKEDVCKRQFADGR